jgi:hypothetical protein
MAGGALETDIRNPGYGGWAKMMTLNDALNAIIDDGIEAARLDYAKPRDTLKREGAIAGFEECRGRQPDEIAALLAEANDRAFRAREDDPDRYWYWRCRAAEIEWVVNVLSNILHAQGLPPIGTMTVCGRLKAVQIVGVKRVG